MHSQFPKDNPQDWVIGLQVTLAFHLISMQCVRTEGLESILQSLCNWEMHGNIKRMYRKTLSESPVVYQENRVRCILGINNNVWILIELGPGEPHKESHRQPPNYHLSRQILQPVFLWLRIEDGWWLFSSMPLDDSWLVTKPYKA